MPKITIYERRQTSGGPVDTPLAPDAGAFEGEGLQQLGAGLEAGGAAIFRATQADEISEMNAKSAEFEADMMKRLNESFKKPGVEDDKEFSRTAIEKLQEDYDGLEFSFDTPGAQRAFEERRARFSSQFDLKATEMQIQLDGERQVKNLKRETNAYQNLVFESPELFTSTLLELRESINSKELDADKKQQLMSREVDELAQQAIRGWNMISPDVAERQLSNPQFKPFIDGDTRKSLLGEIQARRRFLEQRDREMKQKQDEAKDAANEAFKSTLISKVMARKDDPQSLHDAVDASGLESDDQVKMHNFVDKYLKGPVKTNQLTYSRIRDQIFNGDITTTSQILDVAGSEDLSANDLDWLRTELEGFKGPEGQLLKDAKKDVKDLAFSQLVRPGPSGFADSLGKRLMTVFESIRRSREMEFRRAGKSIASLYDTSSPDYLGKLLDTPLFNRGIAEKSQSLIDDFFGGKPSVQQLIAPDPDNPEQKVISPQPPKTTKRKPGESPADYLKRIKGK